MKIIITNDYNHMSRVAANLLSAQVIIKSNSVLGLATGSSPIGIYHQLINWYQKGDIDFSGVTTINLDEYKGLSPDNEQSYHYFMAHYFFNHINIPKSHTFIPNGLETDSSKACQDYNKIISQVGGIDMQLLGIGHNGHIGFNEPGGSFEKETHAVTLSSSTIEANARFFNRREDVPTVAYTMGIKSIMQAKKIVVVVNGLSKAQIVKEAFWGPVTPLIPASILQLHPDTTLVADQDALSKVMDYL